jgi:hypothetical protein
MGHCAFGMLCGYISVAGLAMGHGFLEMRDPFIQMRILSGRPRMFDGFFGMLHQGIGMALFAVRYSFLGMFQGFCRMLVSSKGKSAEQWETDKRGNRRND